VSEKDGDVWSPGIEAEGDLIWLFDENIKVTLVGFNTSQFLLQRTEQPTNDAVVIEFAETGIYFNGMLYDIEDDYETLEQIRTTAAIAPDYPQRGTYWLTQLYRPSEPQPLPGQLGYEG
jgi:hypothetical protein